jgi:Holliday junction DNA helicase RuvA
MYEYLRGPLITIYPTKAVIDVNGIGFSIEIPVSLHNKLPQIGEEVLFYTAHILREDSERLFGFLTLEERNLFLSCSDVSGVGPKTALSLVGHLAPADLRSAIHAGNTLILTKIPGIGKKTAERIIMEMKDRLPKEEKGTVEALPDLFFDATAALMNLGYNLQTAQKAVKTAMPFAKQNISELITKALQCVSS